MGIAVDTTYEDTQRLIQSCVSRLLARYRLIEPQEMLAEANLLFMKAYNSFDRKRGSFSHWLCYTIEKGLTSLVRDQARRARLLQKTAMDLSVVKEERRTWSLEWFLDQLSDEALELVTLVFANVKEGMQPRELKGVLLRTMQRLDWPYSVKARAVREIQGALE